MCSFAVPSSAAGVGNAARAGGLQAHCTSLTPKIKLVGLYRTVREQSRMVLFFNYFYLLYFLLLVNFEGILKSVNKGIGYHFVLLVILDFREELLTVFFNYLNDYKLARIF